MSNLDGSARIDKQDYPVSRLKLRAWLQLEDIRDKLRDATRAKNRKDVEQFLCEYIAFVLPVSIEILKKVPWFEVSDAFSFIYQANLPNTELPLIKPRDKHTKLSSDGFEYPGRSWFMWAHIFADAYGWSLECIAGLEINDAISLIQEILYQDQMQKEWEWGTTEIAYPYDSTTKKSKFHPLKRPD
jgi:hypothetical protein